MIYASKHIKVFYRAQAYLIFRQDFLDEFGYALAGCGGEYKYLKWYVENGGLIFNAGPDWEASILSQIGSSVLRNFVDLCFRTQESWYLDEFSPIMTCLMGAFSHTDLNFRTRIQGNLSEYHALVESKHMDRMRAIFESQFGLESIASRLQTMRQYELLVLFEVLSTETFLSVLKFFIEAGIDVNFTHYGIS